jgi:C1A family cysteine protease
MRAVQTLLAVFCVILIALLATPFAAAQTSSSAPPNPRFLEYLNTVKRGAAPRSVAAGGHGLGLIPEPLDLSHLKSQPAIPFSQALPSSYDLRTLGKVTPVENQGSCDTCWAFTTYGSMESDLEPGETDSFSENNLKNLSGFDSLPCTNGGNFRMSTAYLARWAGPINTSDDPYVQSDYRSTSPPGLPPQKHVQDVFILAGRNGPTDNDTLKGAVMTYGGVATVMYMDPAVADGKTSPYYNGATYSYYYYNSSTSGANHAVTLVGWNDTYSASNFSATPPGDGAFLIKNSWGTGWGDQGYFWVSYYDTVYAMDSSSVFAGDQPIANFTREYSYDWLGWIGSQGYNSETAWFANVYTAAAQEQLEAVSFYAASNDSTYTINIYTGVTGGPTTGTLVGTTIGGLTNAGYYTISLASPVPLASGTEFAAVVELNTPGWNAPIPVHYAVPGYSSNVFASPGHSYQSADGNTWTDTTAINSTMSVCLKAFTDQAPTVSTSPATLVTSGSATLGGTGNPNGLDTHIWFLYSTNSSMSDALSTPQQDIGYGTAAVPSSAPVTGLAANTAYYFQAVAQNSGGTTQGSILNFTTTRGQSPTVTTSAATSITISSAALNGNANPNGLDTHVWFLYSTSSSMNSAASTPQQDIGSGTAAVPVSANISGLAPNMTYYFQAVAQNGAGESQGAILSFTTTGPPTVITSAATSVTSSSATIPGNANPDGFDTHVWFLYATNPSMNSAASTPQQDIGSGTAAVPVSANISGLAPNMTYYFQAVAQNNVGTSYGSILSFAAASSGSAPTVSSGSVTNITLGSATLGGSVIPNGSDTVAWFLYSTNSFMSSPLSTPWQDVGSGTVAVPFSVNVTGLTVSTVYYFQAVARNNVGTSYGSILSFNSASTPPAPPTLISPSNQETGVPLTPILIWDEAPAGATSYDVYFGSSSPPPFLTNVGGTNYSTPMLSMGTTYYWQIVAKNSGGSNPSSVWSFTTQMTTAPPPPTLNAPSAGATGVSVTPKLVWTASSGATSYAVYLGTNPSAPFVANTTGPFYDPPALVPGTTYYWQIIAKNNAGASASSESSFTTQATSAPPVLAQQGPKLVGTGAVNLWEAGIGQGWSAALSADGNTAIVGAPNDNDDVGAAWVYTRTGVVWTQQGSKLVCSSCVYQGWSVGLSYDGNTAIVATPFPGGSVVYTRSGGIWNQQGTLPADPGGNVGYSVAVSGDGNTAIVGDPNDGAWLYTRSGGVWTQQGSKLTGDSGAQFGASVALSGDGNTAIVGGYQDNGGIGATWVFANNGGVWAQQGGKLVGTGVKGGYALQGTSVALSADGNTAIVGGPQDHPSPAWGIGAAWVFTRSAGVWTQQGSKLVGSDASNQAEMGTSVSLSADGNTAIVGGFCDDNDGFCGDVSDVGAAWVFGRSAGVWTQQGSKLVGTGTAGGSGAQQGTSVALSADASTVIVGGPCDNNNGSCTGAPGYVGVGAVWVFTYLQPAKIGTYNTGQWYLDMNGDGTWDGPPDVAGTFGAGLPGAIYVTGDWNGSGHAKMGVFYKGFWYLDFKGDGTWDGGVIDKQYNFGWNDPNVIPVVGDWNGDGRTKIGIYYQGFWYLDYDGNGVWDGGVNDKAYNFGWPATGVTPMVGDWSGTGTAKIGVYYYGFWYLDYDGDGVWNPANDKAYTFGWNATGVTPILGDWNGDGRAKIGIYYQGFWYLDYDGNGVWDGGVNDKMYNLGWSDPAVKPVIGDWSGGGTAKIGVFYNGYWYLDYIGNGIWDGGIVDKAYVWGQPGDTPVVGKW